MVSLPGHELLVLKMDIDSEIDFWQRLSKHEEQRSSSRMRDLLNAEQCIHDHMILNEKFSDLLDSLPLRDIDTENFQGCID